MNKRTIGMALALAMAVGAAAFAQSRSSAPAPAGPVIVLETAKGLVEIELFPQDAPKSVDHILKLVRRDFYRGLRFHWVTAGIIQIGDPLTRNMAQQESWGKGGSGQSIGVSEVSKRSFDRGSVGLQFFFNDPKEADSQFFITKVPSPNLNGKYTMIGKVVKGMDVIDKVAVTDMLKRAYVKGETQK